MVEKHIVIGAQLRRARETLRSSPDEVGHFLNVEPEEILDWEAERKEPGLEVLERLAEFYGREIDYFLRDDIPSPPSRIQFRSVTRQPFESLPAEARRVIARFDELCRTAYELEQTLDKVQPPQIQHVPSNYSPTNLAQNERIRYVLDNKPIRNLRTCLTKRGIRRLFTN